VVIYPAVVYMLLRPFFTFASFISISFLAFEGFCPVACLVYWQTHSVHVHHPLAPIWRLFSAKLAIVTIWKDKFSFSLQHLMMSWKWKTVGSHVRSCRSASSRGVRGSKLSPSSSTFVSGMQFSSFQSASPSLSPPMYIALVLPPRPFHWVLQCPGYHRAPTSFGGGLDVTS
jgi:hypothetical protein